MGKTDMNDYQWPSLLLKSTSTSLKSMTIKSRRHVIEEVEKHFEKIFGHYVVLVPSARSAISAFLSYNKISRGHQVYTPLWSSACLQQAVIPYSNPCPRLDDAIDAAILVHKWGQVHKVDSNYKITIEDSVDSIHLAPEAFFPNRGQIEVISLPKVMNIWAGGLVVTQDKGIRDFYKERQEHNTTLGFLQERLKKNDKFKNSLPQAFTDDHWHFREHQNSYVSGQLANEIMLNLESYEENKAVIQKRVKELKRLNIVPQFDEHKRLGPVAIFKSDKESKLLMSRHYPVEIKQSDELVYKKGLLIPLHFAISDDLFEKMLLEVYKINNANKNEQRPAYVQDSLR